MISFKRFSGRRGDGDPEGKAEASAQQKPARDVWGVVVEPMKVSGEAVYALSFHRKGTSVYYLHRHYRNRMEAEKEFMRLSQDLGLGHGEFELKYALDGFG